MVYKHCVIFGCTNLDYNIQFNCIIVDKKHSIATQKQFVLTYQLLLLLSAQHGILLCHLI